MNVYTSLDQLIGKTPLLELTHIEKEYNLKAKLLAKLESMEPAGSAKDRVALAMIVRAEREGKLTEGSTVIESTSGNTGIALCALCAARGYRAIIVMPDNMSVERIRLMKAYGAEVVLSPAEKGMAGAIAMAEELAKQYELETDKVKNMVPVDEIKTSLETRKAIKVIVDFAVAVAPKKEEAPAEE